MNSARNLFRISSFKKHATLNRPLLHTIPQRNVQIKSWPNLENPWFDDSRDKFASDIDPQDLPGFEVCKEEFKHVEKLLSNATIAPAPSSPTKSGWVPPDPAKYRKWPYFVRRSRNHMIPVYFEERNRKLAEQTLGTRQLTVIRSVQGDMRALARELEQLLEGKHETGKFICQVDEATRTIRIDGIFLDEVASFLIEKGF